MCGRYSFTSPPEAVRQLFRLQGPLPNFPARYNIAPTQEEPVVRLAGDGESMEITPLRWGLVPSWSRGPDSGYSMINARAETIGEKPAFRAAFGSRRCLVPADGFYEWQKAGGRKQPHYITLKGGGPMAFAGLWERWQGSSQEEIESFSIIVTNANELLRPIHERMPVIIDPADFDTWLRSRPDDARELLHPYPSERMHACPVSTHVNSPANDDAQCIEPIGRPLSFVAG